MITRQDLIERAQRARIPKGKKAADKDEKKADKEATHSQKIWFEKIAAEHFRGGVCACMECGVIIPISFARHATAHLLPKKLFKSLATHPVNYLILGAGCGCHDKTHTLETFVKMKIWPEAARRIKEMLQTDLPHDELKYLSNQLLQALDKTDV